VTKENQAQGFDIPFQRKQVGRRKGKKRKKLGRKETRGMNLSRERGEAWNENEM